MRTDCSQLHIRDVDVTFNLYFRTLPSSFETRIVSTKF